MRIARNSTLKNITVGSNKIRSWITKSSKWVISRDYRNQVSSLRRDCLDDRAGVLKTWAKQNSTLSILRWKFKSSNDLQEQLKNHGS
jgi:hypothetical protein